MQNLSGPVKKEANLMVKNDNIFFIGFTVLILLFSQNSLAVVDRVAVERLIQWSVMELEEARKQLNKTIVECERQRHIDVVAVLEELPVADERQIKEAIHFISRQNYVDCVAEAEKKVLWKAEALTAHIDNARVNGILVQPEILDAPIKARQKLVGISAKFQMEKAYYRAMPFHFRKKLESIDALHVGTFDDKKLWQQLSFNE